MKKGFKIVGALALAGGVFAAGSLFSGSFGASGDWQTNAINTANSTMGSAAYNKKTELIEGADEDINATVLEELSLEERQLELQRLLDEYYNLKLQGFTGSDEFKALEAQIQLIQDDILNRYKTEIDNVFNQQ